MRKKTRRNPLFFYFPLVPLTSISASQERKKRLTSLFFSSFFFLLSFNPGIPPRAQKMTTSARQQRRRSFSFLLLVAVPIIALLALAANPAEAKKKNPAPAPAPSPALAEAARARAEAALASSRAEAAAAAAAARALDDLPRGSGTKPFQLQYLGTHRSYRVAPPRAATAFLRSADGAAALAAKAKNDPGSSSQAAKLAQILSPVSREPLAEQAEKGIRAFHLDAWADGFGSEGGKEGTNNSSSSSSSLYAAGWAGPKLGGASSGGDRRGRGDAASAASTAALMRSNPRAFKVFSDPDFDGLSVCATLSICLADLKGWSDARPGHSPVVVFVEPRDDALFKGSDVARIGKSNKGSVRSEGAALASNGSSDATEGGAEAASSSTTAAATFDEILKELTLSAGPTSLASPPKIDAAALVALDEEIRAALGGKRAAAGAAADEPANATDASQTSSSSTSTSTPTLFTPEDLRAASNMSSGSLLARNVLARGGRGWPDVNSLRGRILVVVVGGHAGLYAETMSKTKRGGGAGGRQAAFAAAPSQDAAGPDTLFLDLAPRAIAVDQAGNPVAPAPAKVLAKWEDAVSTAARSAFLVRAAADFGGAEAAAMGAAAAAAAGGGASASSPSRAEAVLRSGATFVMTDYPPFAPEPTTGYSVSLERGGGAGVGGEKKKAAVALRCNPVTATKNPSSLSFAEVGCAAVPPPQPPPSAAPKKGVSEVGSSSPSAAGAGGEDASPESSPVSPPANGDGPSPDDPYYGGDGSLLVAAPAPAPPPVAKKQQPVSTVPAAAAAVPVSKATIATTSPAAAAAVSTAARPKQPADAEVVRGFGASAADAADAAVAAPAAPKKKAAWASPVDTFSAAPLDADAAAVPPALAAEDEAATTTTTATTATGAAAPVAAAAAATAAKPAAAAAAPAPRRPGYATPAGADEGRPAASSSGGGRSSSSGGGGGAASSSSSSSKSSDDDAPAVPRRRFLDPNAAPEAVGGGGSGPSFIPLSPSKIESGDSPDGGSSGGGVPAMAARAAPVAVSAASAADGEVAPAPRSLGGGGAKKAGAADGFARPRGFQEDEEANSHTGDAALAMPSLLP